MPLVLRQRATTAITAVYAVSIKFTMAAMLGRLVAQLKMPRLDAHHTEVVSNVLFVLDEAMKLSGKSWPVISQDVQERCLTRISGRVRFIEGLTPGL